MNLSIEDVLGTWGVGTCRHVGHICNVQEFPGHVRRKTGNAHGRDVGHVQHRKVISGNYSGIIRARGSELHAMYS